MTRPVTEQHQTFAQALLTAVLANVAQYGDARKIPRTSAGHMFIQWCWDEALRNLAPTRYSIAPIQFKDDGSCKVFLLFDGRPVAMTGDELRGNI